MANGQPDPIQGLAATGANTNHTVQGLAATGANTNRKLMGHINDPNAHTNQAVGADDLASVRIPRREQGQQGGQSQQGQPRWVGDHKIAVPYELLINVPDMETDVSLTQRSGVPIAHPRGETPPQPVPQFVPPAEMPQWPRGRQTQNTRWLPCILTAALVVFAIIVASGYLTGGPRTASTNAGLTGVATTTPPAQIYVNVNMPRDMTVRTMRVIEAK